MHPSITAPRRLMGELGEAMDITARFVRWWGEHPEAADAVGLPRPNWQVELLHAAAGDAIRSRAGTVMDRDDGPLRGPVVDLVERRVAVTIPPSSENVVQPYSRTMFHRRDFENFRLMTARRPILSEGANVTNCALP